MAMSKDERLALRRRSAPRHLERPDEIRAALAAHDAVQAESDAIRRAAGLSPVPEGGAPRAWRAKLVAAGAADE